MLHKTVHACPRKVYHFVSFFGVFVNMNANNTTCLLSDWEFSAEVIAMCTVAKSLCATVINFQLIKIDLAAEILGVHIIHLKFSYHTLILATVANIFFPCREILK